MVSLRSSTRLARWTAGSVIAGVVAALVAACGDASHPPADNGSATLLDASTIEPCSVPTAGCACSPDGQKASCGYVKETFGNYVACAQGSMTCTGGQWGPCVADHATFQSTHATGGGFSTEALGMNSDAGDAGQTNCVANPCDPTCQTFVDNSNGVDGGPGLVPVDGGWTLSGGAGLDASTQCFVTLTGTVYDPASQEPVYNAVVAIPYTGTPVGSGSPPPVPTGVPLTDACGGTGFSALRAAYTGVNGSFTLPGVPVQSAITLVIQIGRWRRVVTVNTSACGCGSTINISPSGNTTTCLGPTGGCSGLNNYLGTAACMTRLPRTQSEGNIPHIALGAGSCDPQQCMLYRMGIAASEFTDENGPGRVHFYTGAGDAYYLSGSSNDDISALEGFSCSGAYCAPNATTNITNASFESSAVGSVPSGWTASGVAGGETTTNIVSVAGTQAALLGKAGATTNGSSTLKQTFTAPANATALGFWAQVECAGGSDGFVPSLKDNSSGNTCSYGTICNSGSNSSDPTQVAWYLISFDAQAGCPANFITPGHSYTLTLTNNDASGKPTWSFVDKVQWHLSGTPPNLLDNYDLVMLPCSCSSEYGSYFYDDSPGQFRDDVGRRNLVSYANAGGRIFSSHWGREWLERGNYVGGSSNGWGTAGQTYSDALVPFANVANWYPVNGSSPTWTLTGNGPSGVNCGGAYTCSIPPLPPVAIQNPSFETGSLSGWTTTGADTAYSGIAIDGSQSAIVGLNSGFGGVVGNSTISQTFTAPVTATGLEFFAAPICPTGSGSYFSATLLDQTKGTTYTWAQQCTTGSWYEYQVPVTAGDSLTLTFTNHNTGTAGTAYTFVDDIFWSLTGYFDTSTTRGQNLASWMNVVNGDPAKVQITTFGMSSQDVKSTQAASVQLVFARSDNGGNASPDLSEDFTFDTPVGGSPQYGRTMYTDMHLSTWSSGNGYQVSGGDYFPSMCAQQGTKLAPQELAAEYMLFDLGQCITGQPVPGTYPPVITTGNGTNSSCSGGNSLDSKLQPSSCMSDANCEEDFHCASGVCVWSGGSGYYDSTCLNADGTPGIDLTLGVPCGTTTGYQIPVCNRGGGTLAAGSVIRLENSGNGGSPSAPWSCAAPPTPNPPSVSAGSATCSYTLPTALGPGQCMNIDTTTPAGSACSVLEVGQRYLYINYDQSIHECGTGFTGTGPGCMNNTSATKTTGGTGCPAVCGGVYQPATFTRDFDGVCPSGYRVVWHLFSWSGVTPSDSSLDFQAWTADTQAQLGVQFPTPATIETPAPDDHANGYVDNQAYAQDVDTRLLAAGYPGSGQPPYASHTWLRVNMILAPSSDGKYAPTLNGWNQAYDCVPAE